MWLTSSTGTSAAVLFSELPDNRLRVPPLSQKAPVTFGDRMLLATSVPLLPGPM